MTTNHNIEKPTILLQLSGGLDSIGCLFKLLTEPKYAQYDIYVHHTKLINAENRMVAEQLAVGSILAWFKAHPEYKSFEYAESTFECPSVNGLIPFDADVTCFTAGLICEAAPSIKFVAAGRSKTDENASSAASKFVINRANQILSLFTGKPKEAIKIYPIIDYTRQQVWDFLPDDLRTLAWSCRKPTYTPEGTPVKCGKCVPCTSHIG